MISTYAQSIRLNWFKGTAFPTAPTNLFFSLHSADPSVTGASEVTATFATARATYSTAAIGAIATVAGRRTIKNTAILSFGNAIAAGSIPFLGIWDAVTAGNFLGAIQIVDGIGAGSSLVFGNGDPISLPIGSINILQLDTFFWSVYLQDAFLNWFKGITHPAAPATTHLGLFTALTSANVGNEVTNTIRAAGRVSISSSGWSALSTVGLSQRISNANLANFGSSAGAVSNLSFAGIYDASTAGNLLVFSQITARNVAISDPISLDVSAIKLRVG